ncbi:MAG: F0F1 ATP synthase subunit B [Candidatus Andersenbacteria bacterium]|nr:F0F1 ATP synthase subunit B [bacterium]MDZ4225432.1 F0F1 ATP synthase subunit B [Candidatus Andersenbacteria bacterium]
MLTLIALASESAPEAATGIASIGLQWQSLLLQIVNFAILLLLLRLFAYKPILNVLETRRRKIAEGLANAQDIAKTKQRLETDKAAILNQARQDAQDIIAASRTQAKQIIQDAENTAGTKAKQKLTQAAAQIKQEVTTARDGLKQEMRTLVALATEKIIGAKLESSRDRELIEEAIKSAAHPQQPE